MTVDIYIIVVNDRTDYQNTGIELFTNWFQAWMRFAELLEYYCLTYQFSELYGFIDDKSVTNQNWFDLCNDDNHITFDVIDISIT